VKLDDLDISQISNRLLSERIGYLQQEHRLFSGTLRENLLIGIVDPGDDVIKAVAAQTGLLELISGHPQGLSLPISEGGAGLSGGQKQLVAFTRLLLGRPSIWILDEPTASMDANAERLCITALLSSIKRDDTMILVTHKPQLLQLVNRLILISDQKIVIDGDRDQVLRQLNSGGHQHSPSASL
jgi:ATP-binding cassette subfamily C protein LapB